MKLSVAQIMLGLGILLVMALSIAWDSSGFYIRVPLGEPSSWKTIFNPDTKEVVATTLSFLVLLLGLTIIVVSIALLKTKIRFEYAEPNSEMNIKVKKLVIIQIGLGLLVAVSAFLVFIWGFPTTYFYTLSDNLGHVISFTPGYQFVLAQLLSGIAFLLGIVSLVCSVVQFRLIRF